MNAIRAKAKKPDRKIQNAPRLKAPGVCFFYNQNYIKKDKTGTKG